MSAVLHVHPADALLSAARDLEALQCSLEDSDPPS